MLLATIFQCVLLTTTHAPINAADAWSALFKQMENIDIPNGKQSTWTDSHQSQYEQLSPLIKQAREIAMIPDCDWNLDYSQGFGLELPHLPNISKAVQLISFSIQGDTKAGNVDSALMGMQSILGLSSHANDQGTIIGSLVSYSVFSIDKDLAFVFEESNNTEQLQSFMSSLNTLDPFDPFGIRESVVSEKELIGNYFRNKNIEDIDLGGLIEEPLASDMDIEYEIARYENAMDIAIEIFQMQDKNEAIKSSKELQEEVTAGEHGELTMVLFMSSDRLIETAFSANEAVQEMQLALQQRIDILAAPNSATYFLQAADEYCAIDKKDKKEALEKGDYEIFGNVLSLLAKAAEMKPTRITQNDDPQTPAWIAPIYALTMDGLERATTNDFITALRVAGHLSQQERLAASVAALMIVDSVTEFLPEQLSQEETARLLEATRRVPAADAFMILGTTNQEKTRYQNWVFIEEGWNPKPMALLAATITLAKESGEAPCGNSWDTFIDEMGIPDDDTIVLAAVTQNMPETLIYAEFENEQQFVQKLRGAKNRLPALRRKLSTPPTRR